MYVVTVDFEVNPEFKEDFLLAMKQQAKDSLEKEPNCTYFDVCVSEDNPNLIFLYELYATKSDFDTHLESSHFKSFSEKVAPWVASKKVHTLTKV